MAARPSPIIWAKSAQEALDDVIEYIAQDSRDRAVEVLRQVLNAASSLEQFAERGRVVPETGNPSVRELFVFQYRLIYRVESNRVVIVAFLHGARDFASWRHKHSLNG